MNYTIIIGGLCFVAAILGALWGIHDHKQFTRGLSFEVARIQLLLSEMQDLLHGL